VSEYGPAFLLVSSTQKEKGSMEDICDRMGVTDHLKQYLKAKNVHKSASIPFIIHGIRQFSWIALKKTIKSCMETQAL